MFNRYKNQHQDLNSDDFERNFKVVGEDSEKGSEEEKLDSDFDVLSWSNSLLKNSSEILHKMNGITETLASQGQDSRPRGFNLLLQNSTILSKG